MRPQWPAPSFVKALFTTRQGGHSTAPWDSWNMGEFVGDERAHVQANRALLQQAIQATSVYTQAAAPRYLKQVHGCDVHPLTADATTDLPPNTTQVCADAAITTQPGVVCTIMVGDCLPVLFAHKQAPVVAAAHAGWRGLAGTNGQGILETSFDSFRKAVKRWFQTQSQSLTDAEIAHDTLVWLGPCIGPQAFEVGKDVRNAFVDESESLCDSLDALNARYKACFLPHPQQRPDHWMAHLSGVARIRLQKLGITQLHGNDGSAPWCTVRNAQWYFSHRRDAAQLGSTGRMAACIWLDRT
ncbi:laccase [Lampropedia puyangensis]|uniref:Laccase n=1 Tax=Lampropedia puyangensis TaxID=1330072 RepID=A0A4S8FFH7_9BURK|nr:laccase [Lampropedia puyangensis]